MTILRFGNTTSQMTDKISDLVPRTAQLQDLFDTYPNGVRHGTTFMIGSFQGEAGSSLQLNIDIHNPNFMRGQDWATGAGVGGITKILMEGRGWTLKEVSAHYQTFLGIEHTPPPENPIKPELARQPEPIPIQQPEQVSAKKVYNLSTPFDAEYSYTDEDGVVLVSVRKYVETDSEGNTKKQFRQFMDGRMGLPEPRPLYNIPNILASDKVIWAEGEKCADALTSMGFAATTTIGGAGMLSDRVADKFDFSPLNGKDVVLWPDNDKAGHDLAVLVERLAKAAGAKSTVMLRAPFGKPEKWDAADALDEQFDVHRFIRQSESKVKKPIHLLDDSLNISKYFVGNAPEQQYLIGNTIPLAVPVIFAAAGDSGKGMMTLDLAMKVASGESMQSSFGGIVSTHGDAIILSAEDDKDEMHRRIERMDPLCKREHYPNNLKILPLPNLGGVFPIMQKIDTSYVMGEEFGRIYDQILEMQNLALLVIDPMASFVHADVNADPAAGAAFMGMLAQISTETGATVMVNHHMAKIKDNDPVTTPEQARNLIRGTSAIVDGVRCAFSVWNVEEKTGRQRCKDLQVTYSRNAVFDGAVVKSNGPANRDIRHFIRNPNTGLLEDRSDDIRAANSQMSEPVRQRLQHMQDFIAMMEREGNAITKGGAGDGAFDAIATSASGEPCVIALKEARETTIKNTITALQEAGRVDTYRLTQGGTKKWLGVTGGMLSTGEYEARTARENL